MDALIEGKNYSEGELRMLLRAVRRVLTNDLDIEVHNCHLLETAIHIGLVTEEECDFG